MSKAEPTSVEGRALIIDGVGRRHREVAAPLLYQAPAGQPGPIRNGDSFLLASDIAGVLFGLLAAWAASAFGLAKGTVDHQHHLGFWTLTFVPVYVVVLATYGVYRRGRRRLFATSFPDLVYIAHAAAVGALLVLVVSHLGHRSLNITPVVALSGAVLMSVPMVITVPASRGLLAIVLRRRRMIRSRVIILGSGAVADSLARGLAAFEDLELLGCVDDPGGFQDGGRGVTSLGLLGQVQDLPRICADLSADRVVVAFSPTKEARLADTLRQLPDQVRVSVVPRMFDLLTWRSHIEELHGMPVVDVAPPVLTLPHRAAKRAMDIAIALFFIVGLAPIWIAISIAVGMSGPVLFTQERAGRGGRPFRIYKFRTMRVGAHEERAQLGDANEVDGPLFKIKDDPRVTRVGRFLRASSLDEFPQFLNVLKGDMSIVGPRPFVIDESDCIKGWAARRFDVRPGMTGLWQVSGRNDLPFDELQRLDYAYVASWSLAWDLKIMWQTPGCVVHRRGAY